MLTNRYLHQSFKYIAVLAASLSVVAGFNLLMLPKAYADSYVVNASVPYSPPDQLAVIQPDLNGTTAHDALVTISGTCQVKHPLLVVSIWRNGSPIGSASCDGNFTIQVMLLPGVNNLVARTSNISGTYGPDSSAVTITLMVPSDQPNQQFNERSDELRSPVVTDKQPATLQERALATTDAAESGLGLLAADPFSVLSNRNEATLSLIVSGGLSPYTVSLNWGNGSEAVHNIVSPGTYDYDYNYKKPGNYTMHGWVRDSRGAYAEFSYAIVSKVVTTSLSLGAGSRSSTPKSGVFDFTGRLPVSIASAGAVGGIALLSFWLGAHHLVIGSVQQASAALKSARSPAKTAKTKTSGPGKRNTVRRGKTVKPKRNCWGIIKL